MLRIFQMRGDEKLTFNLERPYCDFTRELSIYRTGLLFKPPITYPN